MLNWNWNDDGNADTKFVWVIFAVKWNEELCCSRDNTFQKSSAKIWFSSARFTLVYYNCIWLAVLSFRLFLFSHFCFSFSFPRTFHFFHQRADCKQQMSVMKQRSLLFLQCYCRRCLLALASDSNQKRRWVIESQTEKRLSRFMRAKVNANKFKRHWKMGKNWQTAMIALFLRVVNPRSTVFCFFLSFCEFGRKKWMKARKWWRDNKQLFVIFILRLSAICWRIYFLSFPLFSFYSFATIILTLRAVCHSTMLSNRCAKKRKTEMNLARLAKIESIREKNETNAAPLRRIRENKLIDVTLKWLQNDGNIVW